MEETIEQLRHLIAERLNLNIALENVAPDVQLLEDGLRLDSLALVELITLVEEQFGIEFHENDFDIETFGNLRSLAAVIVARGTMDDCDIG
ncbi:MAG TPA: phosphopantetheine-binding protein [Bryobacteraceae bacterium]|nr:phosphopantetheine-binding protein [Bryobacteraceae bacterium]